MYDRDRVLDGVDLAELADELLGPRKGNQCSGTWPCPNPQHPQTGRTPPVNVFTTRRGEQRWRCHGCGVGGTAIDLVMACHSVNVREALSSLADRTGARELEDRERVPRQPEPDPLPVASVEAVAALDAYVRSCAERLWQPGGRPVREWLVHRRRLPEEVLRTNLVGADPGPREQARPDGVPRASGAVFPAIENDRAVFAQLRRLHPTAGQSRWLSVAGRLAPNPKLALYRPSSATTGGPTIVSEGPVDALSACTAGFTSAAVLGAAAGDASVAARLATLPGPLVLAFDCDEAGRSGAEALSDRLRRQGRRPVLFQLPTDATDLNEWHAQESRWAERFSEAMRDTVHRAGRPPPSLG